MGMKVLVVGQGGREHCVVWKICQSPRVDKVWCAPGNGGTSLIAENVPIQANDIEALLAFAKKMSIDLVVVGPEAPLVGGIVDRFTQEGIKIFGPTRDLALLEGSKVFAKQIMRKYNIPTSGFEVFSEAASAKKYVMQRGAPLVIKADGLAAGKGVVVAHSIDEAHQAIDMIMVEKKFGASGERIVIEEYLEGEEVSLLIFTDGKNIVPLVSSQDHKRVFDDDKGPNTGGMGAYSPAPLVRESLLSKVNDEICMPLIEGLRTEGRRYQGMLYLGLMIKEGQPSVLEFNVRFGDPETQAILPKLKSDLVEIMLDTVEGNLSDCHLDWDPRFCLCVVLASGGYPHSYEKGKKIQGLEALEEMQDIFVFHAGTKYTPSLVTNGGRVLNVAGLGTTLKDAQKIVYSAIENIRFEGMHYRRDIGNRALNALI
jgi:phosphoribosylamine--glycine ligase